MGLVVELEPVPVAAGSVEDGVVLVGLVALEVSEPDAAWVVAGSDGVLLLHATANAPVRTATIEVTIKRFIISS